MAWVLCAAPAAAAQDQPETRAEWLRQQRAAKLARLEPNTPDALQTALNYAETRGLFLLVRDGFHPKLRTLTTGSGWAFGAGYRNRAVFARRGVLELWTAASLKKYWAVEGRAAFPSLSRGRFMAEGVVSLREYPREEFFGLGAASRRADQSSFSLRTFTTTARGGVRPIAPLTLGGGVGVYQPRAGRGRDERLPSVEHVFHGPEIPAFGARVTFVESMLFAEFDYREPLNARRGGYYRFDVTRYNDVDDAWTFTRTELDLRQYVSLLGGRRVLALRGWLSSADPGPASGGVPFFLMPSLGGHDTLRGFRNYRFRGPHALLLQAEYRWELWAGLEAALFYDAGKVGMRRRDLDIDRLESNYGFGFRFNTRHSVVLRIDSAFGSRDGKHFHIALAGVF